MLPSCHCSVDIVGLNTSFRFSTHGKNFCIFRCQTVAHCQSQLTRYSKSADYILPHKLNNIFMFNGGEGFRFYPFAKIVGGHQQ